jgi:hypothetical protein
MVDYASTDANSNFLPYEFRSAGHAPPAPHVPVSGIMLGIRLDPSQSKIYRRAVLHYSLRAALQGFLSASTTATSELWLSRSTSAQRRAALYSFSNSIRRVHHKKVLHLCAIIFPILIESVAFYIHTLRTVHRIKRSILPASFASRYPPAASRAFVHEQLRHTLLGIPRPKRPALSSPAQVPLPSSFLQFANLLLLYPVVILQRLWATINRFNNSLKHLLTYVLSRTLPTVLARTYLPFFAVPGWALLYVPFRSTPIQDTRAEFIH